MTEHTYNLGSALCLTVETHETKFGLTPNHLYSVAVRQNEKRSFLFVSKVLGKHLPVSPAVFLAAGKLLGLALTGETEGDEWAGLVKGTITLPFSQVMERLDQTRRVVDAPTLFIGFAETATGLARAVADSFTGDLRYVSSTRAELPGPAPLAFDEAHSHARNHLLHLDSADPFWKRCKRAVLIDDELTTGRTALRLIERLHETFGIQDFALLTLLDNSGTEERKSLEQRLGIRIELHVLLHGRILSAVSGPLPPPLPLHCAHTAPTTSVRVSDSIPDDRRPLSAADLETARHRARALADTITAGSGDLFLGTGECIYFPALVAGWRGCTAFHSSTQSPVLPLAGSAVISGGRFAPVETYSAAGYLYNVPENTYSRAVVVAESAFSNLERLGGLLAHLNSRGVEETEVVFL